MAIPTASYTPEDGLKNAGSFPTIPDSEDAARKQIQDMFDQILAIVNSLIETLGSEADDASGADNIGVTTISGVTGNTIQAALEDIKVQFDALVAGEIDPDTILIPNSISSSDMFADGVVTGAKIADGTITGEKIGSKQVAAANIADGAVGTAKLAQLAVRAGNIDANAVTEAKILNGAVTADKIAANSCGTTKIPNAAITGAKIAGATITGSNIASATVTGGNIAGATISEAKLDAALVAKLGKIKNITVSTASPSGGSNGDIWIKLI